MRAALEQVPDPRARRGVRYRFNDLLAVLECAVVGGARTLTVITESAAHVAATCPDTLGRLVPSLATIHRICAAVDAAALDRAVSGWVRA